MVQFVNIREFKIHTEAVLDRLNRSDLVLTVRGQPRAVLHKISERDLRLEESFTEEEWDKLDRLAREPGKVYKTGTQFLKSLKRL